MTSERLTSTTDSMTLTGAAQPSATHTLCTRCDRIRPEPNAGGACPLASAAALDVCVRTVSTSSPTTCAVSDDLCSLRSGAPAAGSGRPHSAEVCRSVQEGCLRGPQVWSLGRFQCQARRAGGCPGTRPHPMRRSRRSVAVRLPSGAPRASQPQATIEPDVARRRPWATRSGLPRRGPTWRPSRTMH